MALLTTQLVVAGTLLVAPSHPALIRKPGAAVWFSSPRFLDVQSAGTALTLKAKERGLLHATGLDAAADAPQRIQSVSDANYDSFKRCPHAPLDLAVAPPAPPSLAAPNAWLACGFDELSIPANAPLAPFESAEAKLAATGLRYEYLGLEKGRRVLQVYGAQAERARRALAPFAAFYDIRGVEAPRPGRTLVFEVSLFEFSRAKAASMGVRWPRGIAVKPLESGSARWNAQGLEIGADFGESLGLGRVLARPQIRTKPGEKATFQSGGEIPIRNSSAYSSQTTWKNYGLLLTLEPEAAVATGASEITLGFKLELSEPDPSTAIDGVPGMSVRRLESRFDLRTNETTILTTLIQTRAGTQRSGLLGFKDVPLLQALFGHGERTEQDSELWFAIRPAWEEIQP